MINFLKKRWYLILILIIFMIIGFIKIKSDLITAKDKNKKHIVKRQNLKEVLSLSGEINAEEQVSLRFQSSGKLAWVGVKEGDYVKKYQGIASLDQKELQKNLQRYLNTYMKTRWDFDQTKEDKDIKNIGGLSEEARRAALRVLDKAQFDLNNSVIDVELRELAIQYSYLYTPIEGIVTKVSSPYAGVNITPAQAEFEIINPKTVYFSATVDQNDVVKLKEGEKAEVVLDAYPDKIFSGKISMISFVPKEGETGTAYEVKIFFDAINDFNQYRIGMTGDASFIIKEKKKVLAIPSDFLKTEKEKKYVYKLDKENRIKTFVETGDEIDDYTLITSGLKEGDVITD